MKLLVVFLFLFFGSTAFAQYDAAALKFIPNKGQWDGRVLYRADLPGGKLYAESNRFTYIFYDTKKLADQHTHHNESTDLSSESSIENAASSIDIHAFRMVPIGANPSPLVIPSENASSEVYNFFLGDDSTKWAAGLRASSSLEYKNLYNNIDFKFFKNETALKYEFIVNPGASISTINLSYEGVQGLSLVAGKLIIKTSVTTIIENTPFVYQVIEGKRVEVKSKFTLSKRNAVGFKLLERYDTTKPLIVDPELIFSTYSGSTADNWGNTAAFDEFGNMYSGGTVFNVGYPTTVGAYQVAFGGIPHGGPPFFTNYGIGLDVGILKFNSTGTALLYATYLGGLFTEAPYSLIVNANDELVIMGTTSSNNFPTTAGAYDNSFNGGTSQLPIFGINFLNGSDIFVSKLSANGSALVASTYVGGSSNDGMQLSFEQLTKNYGDQLRGDVITDDLNNIYVACNTRSSNFPISPGAYQTTFGGLKDACVFKLSNDMSTLIWSTYLGGTSEDAAYSIQVDSLYNVYVCGGTNSSNFPTTSGVYQPTYNGGIDGFIAHLNSDGGSLLQSTFVGTSSYDQLYFIQLDQQQEVYVFGQTRGIYPVTPSTYTNANAGQLIHGFSSDLSTTLFSTVIGSGGFQPNISPTAFLVNECGNIFLSGWGGATNPSSEGYVGGNTNGMAVTADAFRSTSDGSDFYIMVLQTQAQQLLYATYFGMNDPGTPDHVDGGTSRFDRKGIIYEAVCGGCGNNDNFPTTPNAWSRTNNSFNCNNAAFKFDLSKLEARAITDRGDSCGRATVSIINTSIGGKDFFWDFGDGTTSTLRNPGSHAYSTPGLYTITMIATDITTCIGKDTIQQQIFVPPIPPVTIDFTDLTLCEGLSVQFGVTDNPTYTYTWAPASSLSDPAIARPIASPVQTTTYTLVVKDTNQCEVTFDLQVDVLPSPSISFTQEVEICPNTAIQIPFSTTDTVRWEFSPYLSCLLCSAPTITPPEPSDAYYPFELIDQNGCRSEDSIRIFTRPLPTISISFTSKGRCVKDAFVFLSEVAYSDLTCPVFGNFTWNFGDGTTSSSENVFYKFENEGSYPVTIQYAYSAPFIDTITVLSDDSCLKNVFVPNIFTPNGDGNNDLVFLRTLNATKVVFKIFNRWGEEVFRTKSLNEGWNGMYKGVKQTPQVFVYTAEVVFWDDTKKVLEGNITLSE